MEKFKAQKEYKVSWLKLLGVIFFIALIVLVISLLYPKKDDSKLLTTFNNNLKIMKEAGFNYFKNDNLPTNINDTRELSLEEMIDRDLVEQIVDENGKSCNKDSSYIRVTKDSEEEYTLKVNLVCENKSDYIKTTIFVSKNDEDEENSNNNSETNEEVNNDKNSVNNQNTNANNNQNSNTTTNNKNNNSNTSSNKPVVNKDQYVTCDCTTSPDCCGNKVYHSVIFEANGGVDVQKQLVEHGKLAQYQETFKSGYTFMGWYIDKNLTVKYDFTKPVYEKITLYAKWEKYDNVKNEYSVYFDSQNGDDLVTKKVTEGDKVKQIPDPQKNCEIFIGWYLNDVKYDFNTPVNSNIILVAKYKKDERCQNIYTIKFDSNGGSNINNEYVLEGNLASKPNDPTRSGYKFIGWYYNNKKFDFNTKIYQDYVLTAKWEEEKPLYSTYCKIVNETFYSVSFTSKENIPFSYNWKMRFDDIKNTDNLKITEISYLNTYNDYVNAYLRKPIQGLSMAGADKNASVIYDYSLKRNNFIKSLSKPYYENGYWYTDAKVTVNNFNNALSYYAPTIKSNIYIVPFYFKVQYTDFNKCTEDLASNWDNYSGYEIVNSYYK